MEEKTKKTWNDIGEHALHGAMDAAEVVADGIGGTVKGVADGVEGVSAGNEARKSASKKVE